MGGGGIYQWCVYIVRIIYLQVQGELRTLLMVAAIGEYSYSISIDWVLYNRIVKEDSIIFVSMQKNTGWSDKKHSVCFKRYNYNGVNDAYVYYI